MLRHVLGCLTTLTAIALMAGTARAVPVIEQCPQATWTEGYQIWEFIPLSVSQYKQALVVDGPSELRTGMGFESVVKVSLFTGTQVVVVGEAWDNNCNQWMRVLVGDGMYWMLGKELQLI